MPHAVVLNTASKASTTGGTFADTLTANSGDSLSFGNFQQGGARIIRMWGVDSASVAEIALTDSRPESIHDPQFGLRFNLPPNVGGAAGSPGAVPMIEPPYNVEGFPGDTLTFTVTSTAADAVIASWLTEYDNLPGVSAKFATWESVMANATSRLACRVIPVASGTKGAYGTSRAINADDPRWSSGKYYAIIGFTVQIPCTTVAFTGTMWGSQKFGAPAGMPFLSTANFFADVARTLNKPLIPVFNGFDAGNVLLTVADDAASTSPKVDVLTVECGNDPSYG